MTIDEMVAALDERGERWDLYRAHDKRWIVNLGDGRDDPSYRSVDRFTIEAALVAALESVRLPVIPLEPRIYHRSAIKVEKRDRGWAVLFDGGGIFNLLTKRDANERADRIAERSQAAHDAWFAEYGRLARTGTEGVDFRWGTR